MSEGPVGLRHYFRLSPMRWAMDLGFPHSFGEKIRWSTGNVYEGDNPMDLMSGVIRVGPDHGDDCGESFMRADWIDPDEVAVHEVGTTGVYELRPPGAGGVRMLVLPSGKPGLFTSLGARVAIGHDAAVPKQGVEVYRIDQRGRACGRPSGETCWGTSRRTQPYPPTEAGAGYGENLYKPWKGPLGQACPTLRVMCFEIGARHSRSSGNGSVTTIWSGWSTSPHHSICRNRHPCLLFAGRFSDDDGNVHEANIEMIAELGITLGCGPPRRDPLLSQRGSPPAPR